MQINENLIKACLSQNREAQKQLYQLLLPYLRAVANRYLRDTSYSKDALQESYIKIFKGLDKYDFNQAPLKQWAAKITINTCLNYNKRVIGIVKDEFVIGKHEAPILPAVIAKLSKENLFLILNKMPTGYFEVFNLFIIDGYSHKEIASMLDINEDLSKKRLSRAKIWLKKTFSGRSDLINHFNSSHPPHLLN